MATKKASKTKKPVCMYALTEGDSIYGIYPTMAALNKSFEEGDHDTDEVYTVWKINEAFKNKKFTVPEWNKINVSSIKGDFW